VGGKKRYSGVELCPSIAMWNGHYFDFSVRLRDGPASSFQIPSLMVKQ